MKSTTIVTAKLCDDLWALILAGRKRYEVRDESFHDAQAIRYVSATTGNELGMFLLGEQFSLGRDQDSRLVELASVSPDRFHRLFPAESEGGPARLWVARLIGPTNVDELFGEEL
ncbi:hypothetical protein [Bifidobacterium pseudocatenulatum]|uniref:hypothetical protein n=1 Tax=Bifidobacterium pseudocatenulatum TaxID=28026 RepID=UPI000FF17699|nr:hypothetical protein [Bifidobacterium pseudocatenulatum]RHC89859.1 hypothetical protein DW822_06665 [Bifidobacterium pseudocatenulatum]